MNFRTYLRIAFVCLITSCLAIVIGLIIVKNSGPAWWWLLAIPLLEIILTLAAIYQAQRAMDRYRELSSRISHELRTPMTVMKMNIETSLLDEKALTREAFVDILRNNLEEIDRMSEIIEFVLKFSGVERRAKPALSCMDLTAAAAKAVKAIEPMAAKRELTLSFRKSDDLPILGNAPAIDEMMTNLLKNAIAYTPSKGSITVETKRSGDHATLLIADTGIGIPAHDLPHIFKPFYQGENAYSQRRRKRGTGIGLAIVKEIVDFHKAHISVASTLGHGTTISIAFPLDCP